MSRLREEIRLLLYCNMPDNNEDKADLIISIIEKRIEEMKSHVENWDRGTGGNERYFFNGYDKALEAVKELLK